VNPLRDALATTLKEALRADLATCGGNRWPNERFLSLFAISDPDFRLALTESIAEALGADPGWFPMKTREDDAAAIVARMLGET
jgi:hypothetical protein